MNMKYVLDNLIEKKQCEECLGMWFMFNHEGKHGIYRLSPLHPSECRLCYARDIRIESAKAFIMSSERWIEEE
jgi:hypothetical protein